MHACSYVAILAEPILAMVVPSTNALVTLSSKPLLAKALPNSCISAYAAFRSGHGRLASYPFGSGMVTDFQVVLNTHKMH